MDGQPEVGYQTPTTPGFGGWEGRSPISKSATRNECTRSFPVSIASINAQSLLSPYGGHSDARAQRCTQRYERHSTTRSARLCMSQLNRRIAHETGYACISPIACRKASNWVMPPTQVKQTGRSVNESGPTTEWRLTAGKQATKQRQGTTPTITSRAERHEEWANDGTLFTPPAPGASDRRITAASARQPPTTGFPSQSIRSLLQGATLTGYLTTTRFRENGTRCTFVPRPSAQRPRSRSQVHGVRHRPGAMCGLEHQGSGQLQDVERLHNGPQAALSWWESLLSLKS